MYLNDTPEYNLTALRRKESKTVGEGKKNKETD